MGKLHYLTILVFIILLAIISGSIFKSNNDNANLTDEQARHVADYFLQNFTATAMNQLGHPDYKVTSGYLEHFADDDSMKLQHPAFAFYENNIQTWSAQADEAIILQKNNKIFLNGNVILKQAAVEGQVPLLLTAEQLTIEPGQRRAHTRSALKLVKGTNHIEATGMKVDLKKNRIEFLSDTRSHYVLPEK